MSHLRLPLVSSDPAPYQEAYRRGLLDDVVPFWLRHGLDREHGGVFTCLDRDGSVYDSDKSVWFQGRFGWLTATLCLEVERRRDWLDASRSCVGFLRRHCFDADGRMFFTVTRDGRPLRKRRYVFSEMFASMALVAWAALTDDRATIHEGLRIFERACDRLSTPGGIEPKTAVQTRPLTGFGGPMIVLGTGQALRAAILKAPPGPDAGWKGAAVDAINRRIDAAVDLIAGRFVRPELEAVLEAVLADGTACLEHAEGRLVNPGHAIEGAWFMMAEGRFRGESRLVDLGLDMLRWTWKLGWDEEYGGILYFRDVLGRPCTEYWHDMKFWWPQNEAIIATLLAWRITGDPTFAAWHAQAHAWAFGHHADSVDGEWFGWLRRDGTPTHHAKGSLWKGPFHLPRMHHVCLSLLTE